MEQSPSWEANQSLQLVEKFPTFLWNPKVLYRNHKCPPPVPILSRLYPVPTPHSNLLKIHINIILPSTPGSPQFPLSLWLPHQHPVHTSQYEAIIKIIRHKPITHCYLNLCAIRRGEQQHTKRTNRQGLSNKPYTRQKQHRASLEVGIKEWMAVCHKNY
jgi:hypothetical protein